MQMLSKIIKGSKGFTFIEVLVVVAIVAISVTIAAPSVVGKVNSARAEVCHSCRVHLCRMYMTYLEIEGIDSSAATFQQYVEQHYRKVCPEDGAISFSEGHVNCSKHNEEQDDDNNKDDDSIPFIGFENLLCGFEVILMCAILKEDWIDCYDVQYIVVEQKQLCKILCLSLF